MKLIRFEHAEFGQVHPVDEHPVRRDFMSWKPAWLLASSDRFAVAPLSLTNRSLNAMILIFPAG
jgi:hypothetical protein